MKNFNKYICRRCKENDCELSFDNKRYKDISKLITSRKIIKGEPFVEEIIGNQIKACDCIVYLEIKNNNELIVLVELRDDEVTESVIKREISKKFENTIYAISKYDSQSGFQNENLIIEELLLLAKTYNISPQFFKIKRKNGPNKNLLIKKGNRTYRIKLKPHRYNIYETLRRYLR